RTLAERRLPAADFCYSPKILPGETRRSDDAPFRCAAERSSVCQFASHSQPVVVDTLRGCLSLAGAMTHRVSPVRTSIKGPMKRNAAGRRMGLAALAGGLAFVGAAEAVELVTDGSFENTQGSSLPIVKIGGKANPGVGGGWSIFSTYAYSANYTMPLTNGAGAKIGGNAYLRPYPAGLYGIANSSDTVTQAVSLTATTTLTPAKIDSGAGNYVMSAWFCTYLSSDYSTLTLTFLDSSTNVIGTPVSLGGSNFVAALPTGNNGRYGSANFWGLDVQNGTI